MRISGLPLAKKAPFIQVKAKNVTLVNQQLKELERQNITRGICEGDLQ